MSFLTIFLTGVGLAMDAFVVSLTQGMALKGDSSDGKHIKLAVKLAAYFGVFQAIMPLIGWFLGKYFEKYILSFDDYIAFALLLIVGGKMLYDSLKGGDEEEVKSDLKHKQIIALAIATSIDALAIGVSFAFLNVSISSASIIIGLTTFVLCFIAVLLGKKIGGFFQKYAEIAGGVILILMALNILIQNIIL